MTRYEFTGTILGLAIMLSVALVAPASAFTTIMPGDINGDLNITNQDFTLFDTTSNTNPASGPWYPPMCAANSGSNCSPADRTWMTFMVQNNIQHFSGPNFMDFSGLSCQAPCTPAPTEAVTISGDVPSYSVVNSIPAEGPGTACSATWASIFNGAMTATVSVINDTTGGASVPGGVAFTDTDPATATCALSFQATCGPSGGEFTVRVEMPNESYAETPTQGSGTPTTSGVDFFEIGPITCGVSAQLVELSDSTGGGTGTETLDLSIDTSLSNGATLGGYDVTITFDNDCGDGNCADFDSVILGDAPFDVPELNMAGPVQNAGTATATVRIADVHTKDSTTYPANTKTRVKTIQFVNVQGTQTVTANITNEDANNLIDWDGTPIPFTGDYNREGTLQF